jgi:hypothetical protein
MDWDCGLPFLEPCTFINVNVQCYHPLMEGYEFTSFCSAIRVCMCLAMSTICIVVGGTSLATPSLCFSEVYKLLDISSWALSST